MSYALKKETAIWRNPFFAAVAIAHGLALAALAHWDMQQPDSVILQALSVRLLEPDAPKVVEAKPRIEPPKAMPKTAAPPPPQPVLTAAADTPAAPATFAVPPQPVAAPPAAQAAPAAAPVVAARFDADYLQNPKPIYPPMSRRLNEEGKVLLRVHVAADGSAREVEIKQSSGFGRLDAAARDAVSRWRFVPARRGADAVDSWVTVPIVFSLEQ